MKKNPFLIGYLAVTVVGAAVLGYLAYTGYTHYTEVNENYEAQVGKLLSLKNRAPFPSPENNAAYKKLTTEYQTEYKKLVEDIRGMQQPMEAITPQAFQDRLKQMVSEVEAAAKENQVALTPGFYLGFDKYQSALPSNEAAGPLARELAAIRLVVDLLIENRVRSIESVRRDPLPEEGGATAEPSPTPRKFGPGTPTRTNTPASTASNIVQRASFDVAFVTDQGRFRQSLNAITRAPQFLVIRAVNVANSSQEGPSREAPLSETPQPANPVLDGSNPSDSQASGEPATGNSLRVLVGQETLTAALRIEMLTFNLGNSK